MVEDNEVFAPESDGLSLGNPIDFAILGAFIFLIVVDFTLDDHSYSNFGVWSALGYILLIGIFSFRLWQSISDEGRNQYIDGCVAVFSLSLVVCIPCAIYLLSLLRPMGQETHIVFLVLIVSFPIALSLSAFLIPKNAFSPNMYVGPNRFLYFFAVISLFFGLGSDYAFSYLTDPFDLNFLRAIFWLRTITFLILAGLLLSGSWDTNRERWTSWKDWLFQRSDATWIKLKSATRLVKNDAAKQVMLLPLGMLQAGVVILVLISILLMSIILVFYGLYAFFREAIRTFRVAAFVSSALFFLLATVKYHGDPFSSLSNNLSGVSKNGWPYADVLICFWVALLLVNSCRVPFAEQKDTPNGMGLVVVRSIVSLWIAELGASFAGLARIGAARGMWPPHWAFLIGAPIFGLFSFLALLWASRTIWKEG